MKITILVVLSAISFMSFSQEKIVDERTGIEIIFSAEGNIFPDSWLSTTIDAKGISLDPEEYSRSKTVILQALLKYPIAVIKKNLKRIYILKEIEFYGKTFGGTNSTDIVYLSQNGTKNGYSNFYFEQLFHAEFSSILLRNYPQYFDKTNWLKNNSSEFSYGDGGVNALKKNLSSERFDAKINEMGLINQYATSSMENDFNSFAKNLFLPKFGFSELIDKYALLKNKRALIIAFYGKIDSSFSEDFFDKILHPTE
ncbi:MAG: hypothetical protein KKA07_07415 [Bacteroidetes bacterium]|nr:hypothetical protein [Bacteroidota bacterium]MBU1718889.1 hypothetical protein [Bacteroidota bacterium]